ncbi:MAG TPA: UDP-3-O-(3-hydroxymyristoyl)glucosamine N-acyltransferase [Chthoniobacterales bacterium]|jgi:UDP-3-O-[3-hydroxymyristoyl] glucosamine N-acyltransferase
MTLTINDIVSLVGGTLLSGDGEGSIQGVASLVEAQPSDLSFFANPKYLPDLKTSQAGAVLVRPDAEAEIQGALIAVENPSLAFTTVMAKFRPEPPQWAPGIHPRAVVGENCQIDATASIQPNAVIEPGVKIGPGTVIGANTYVGHDSILGDNCLIYPNVTIRERAQIGHRVIIHSGAVIGSDGYGFEMAQGKHQKIPQIGIVQLDDDVEIGANTTIDRARFGRTWIGEGTKVDNLVQIAHNVVIGKHCLIIAQVGISGSTQLGNYVIIAGGAGIVGHVKIGDQAVVAAKSGISKSIPAGTKWMGYYAEPAKEMAQKQAYISRLPKLFARVKALEQGGTSDEG